MSQALLLSHEKSYYFIYSGVYSHFLKLYSIVHVDKNALYIFIYMISPKKFIFILQ